MNQPQAHTGDILAPEGGNKVPASTPHALRFARATPKSSDRKEDQAK